MNARGPDAKRPRPSGCLPKKVRERIQGADGKVHRADRFRDARLWGAPVIGPHTEIVAPFGWTGLARVFGRLCGQTLAGYGVRFSVVSILPSGLCLEMKEFGSGEHSVAIHAIANEIAEADPAPRAGKRAVDVAIVAHNAEFDRAFWEQLSDAFVRKAWACSYSGVAWTSEGFDSARLGHLAIGHGLFFDAHRALDDCRAALEILSRPLLPSGRTALAALLESAGRPRCRIRAVGVPFSARAALKSRGYRWNDGSNGAARAWFVDVDEQALEAEYEFLHSDVYRRTDLAVEVSRFTTDRYSERCR